MQKLCRVAWCHVEVVKMAKNGIGVERYARSLQDQEGVRLLFRLMAGSAGLLVD